MVGRKASVDDLLSKASATRRMIRVAKIFGLPTWVTFEIEYILMSHYRMDQSGRRPTSVRKRLYGGL